MIITTQRLLQLPAEVVVSVVCSKSLSDPGHVFFKF